MFLVIFFNVRNCNWWTNLKRNLKKISSIFLEWYEFFYKISQNTEFESFWNFWTNFSEISKNSITFNKFYLLQILSWSLYRLCDLAWDFHFSTSLNKKQEMINVWIACSAISRKCCDTRGISKEMRNVCRIELILEWAFQVTNALF